MKSVFFFLFVFVPWFVMAQSVDSFSKPVDSTSRMVAIEKEAHFPGGVTGWQKYLEHNLNAGLGAKYIRLKRKQEQAFQTVRVQFLVDKQGKIYNVKTINEAEVHPKLAREAERVIKAGPDWVAAEKNGAKVLYQVIQHITFQVARE